MLLLIQYTLIFASVLILVALGGCISEHSGVINLGLEGIMVIGALGGALMMKYLPEGASPFVLIICTVLMAIIAGVVYSSLLAVACINFKADHHRHCAESARCCGGNGHRQGHKHRRKPRQCLL